MYLKPTRPRLNDSVVRVELYAASQTVAVYQPRPRLHQRDLVPALGPSHRALHVAWRTCVPFLECIPDPI